MRSRSNTRRAFTLLEVILSLAILLALSGAVFGFVRDVTTGRREWLAAAEESRGVTTLLERLEDDLAASIAGDAVLGAGIKGTADRLTVLSRGVGIPVRPDPRNPGSAQRELSDLRGAEYALDKGAKVVSGRRWIGDASAAGGESFPVAERVELLRLRYFDGKEWLEEFDSQAQSTLPVAIEVSLWLSSGGTAMTVEDSQASVPADELAAGKPGEEPAGARPEPVSKSKAKSDKPSRLPDRRRIIVVPDGPQTSWKEGKA